MTAKRLLDRTNFIKKATLADIRVDELVNEDNIFLIEKSKSWIVHRKKLNTAARMSGSQDLFLADGHELTSDKWIEVQSNQSLEVLGPRIPVTGCLNNEFGDGGTLEGLFSKTFGKTATFDLPYAFSFNDRFKGNLDSALGVGPSITIQSSYVCTISANQTGQVFLQPYFTEVDDATFRFLTIKQRDVVRPHFRDTRYILTGEWKTVPSFTILSLNSKPIITCVTDNDMIQCG